MALLIALPLASCKMSQKSQKGTDEDSGNLVLRMSSFKRAQFDKVFFDGISEKLAGNYENSINYFEQAIKINPGSADSYYELALAQVQLNDIEAAEKDAQKAVNLDKTQNKWYMLELGDIYRVQKKWPEAADVYEKIIKTVPDEVENYFRLGAIYEAENKPGEALKVYDRIESKFGTNEDVVFLKHHLYINAGKYQKAEDEINSLLKKDPDNLKYMQILAETYSKEGDQAKALKVYEQIIKNHPDDGTTQLIMADYYLKKGDHAKSYALLKQAFANPGLDIDNKIGILYNNYLMQNNLSDSDKNDAYVLTELMVKAHPDDPKGHAIYGDFLFQDKKYDEARDQYRLSIKTKSNLFAVWQQLLFCDVNLKDYKSLDKESEKALDLFPNQPIVYFMNGVANIELKNYKKASSILESGLNQTVDNKSLEIDFYNNLAEAYYRLNDYAKSDSYFDKVLEKDPDNLQALNNYAYYLSVRNTDLDKAEAMSKKTIEKEPENASYLDTYGWILFKRGNFEDAAKYIKESLDKDKSAAEVNEHYGDVQYKLGKTDIAVEYWKNARQYGSDSPNLDKKIANHKIIE